MKRILLSSVVCLALTACAGSEPPETVVVDSGCADSHEKVAFDMRALQHTLMVAALSCGQEDAYNHFVNKFQASLVDQGQEIKHYFSRKYGDRHQAEMDRFITRLANRVSESGVGVEDIRFCDTMAQLFDDLLPMQPQALALTAGMPAYSDLHGIQACS